MIAGGEGWDDMRDFGRGRETWLRKFLALENGIPSADTFRRVFERLDTEKFHESFMQWASGLRKALKGEVVALDGKTLRRAFDRVALLRKIALNLLKAETSRNNSIRKKRKLSVWDDTYMFQILAGTPKTNEFKGN